MPTRPTIPQYAVNGLPMLPRLGEYIRPNTRAQDRLNSLNQIQFTGSLAPQPPGGDTSGVVYAGGQPPDAGGYVAPQTIPGTARPTTPVVPGRSYGNDVLDRGALPPDVKQQTPWFQNPWTQPFKEDAPWWMKGAR